MSGTPLRVQRPAVERSEGFRSSREEIGDGGVQLRPQHHAHVISRHGHILHIGQQGGERFRSEEHTSELQSLMRISYAVFCLKKKKKQRIEINKHTPVTRQSKAR